MISRRSVLAAAAGLVVVAGGWSVFRLHDADRAFLRDIIREKLSFLTIPDAAVESFIDDYIAHDHTGDSLAFSALTRASLLTSSELVIAAADKASPELAARLSRYRDSIASRFLLSTNYFPTPPESIEYVAYYDPYVTPCYNPLTGQAEEI